MQRMDLHDPERICRIVTEGACHQYENATLNVECLQENLNKIGDLVPIPKCEATAWSGCYRKFSKLKLDIQMKY